VNMPILNLKQLQTVSIQIGRRTFSSQRLTAPAITNLDVPNKSGLTTNNFNATRHQGNFSKVSSRRVHANTLSIPGNKELGVMTAEDLEKRIKHIMVRISLSEVAS
jgi:hypothetical protein